MSVRTRWVVVVALLWAVSLFAVQAIAKAQVLRGRTFPEPKVLSGADLGIRIEGEQDGVLIGPLVVRVNGQWVEARAGSMASALLH
jgi:hypothetical protein